MIPFLLLLAAGPPTDPAFVEVAPLEQLTVCREGPPEGATVVLVPGLSGCAYGFRKLTPLLHDQGLQTVIIEPLAVGESSRPAGADYTLTAQAHRLVSVLDGLGISGAVIVFRLAVERPDLLAGFVSIEAAASEEAISPEIKRDLALAKVVAKIGGKNLLRDRFEENLRKGSGDTGWIDRFTVGRYFRGTGRDVSAAMDALAAMTEQAEPWAIGPRLPEIRIPVVVLLGTAPHDGALTGQDIDDLTRGLADLKFFEVPGAGHFIYEEQPQAVAVAVGDLVRRLREGPASPSGAAPMPGQNGAGHLVQPGGGR
jgi:pimeloyl-ACP methyl ester carboxylesterase